MSQDPRIEAAAKALYGDVNKSHANEKGWAEVSPSWRESYRSNARAALAAADKAATITTAEELEALPVRSVILDECGESFQRLDMEGSAVWSSADLIASDLVELPARVLHWGQA